MDRAHVRKMATEAIDQLVAAVEAGHSQQLREYLAKLGRFHRYSIGNLFLIMAQYPSAHRVAGYRTWQSLGRQVKRGSKAIRILAPIVRRKAQDDDEDEEEETDDEDEVEDDEDESEDEDAITAAATRGRGKDKENKGKGKNKD